MSLDGLSMGLAALINKMTNNWILNFVSSSILVQLLFKQEISKALVLDVEEMDVITKYAFPFGKARQ